LPSVPAASLDAQEMRMTSLGGIGNGGYIPNLLTQSLFNEIDTGGSGSINKSELEQAVTTAGGTAAAADALYAKLDPTNTGSVTEQQFSQNLPTLPFSDQMGAQMIGFQAQGWPGTSGTDGSSQFAQNLFSQIDPNGAGSITKSQLEQAVTAAGGTSAAADALYAKLDPNNTGNVTEQQFAQTLPQMMRHHHHFRGAANSDGGNSVQDALAALFQADGSGATGATSPSQVAQNLFSQIDTSGVGSITKSQLEQAVTAAGGTSAAADALYAQLDPNNTGSVTEQQFAQFLQPPSPIGTTAQDAILALLDPNSQSASNSSASNDNGSTGSSGTAAVNGTTAQAALQALISQLGAGAGANSTGAGASGNTAQDALLALLNDNFGSGPSVLGGLTQDPLLSLAQGGATGSIFNSSGATAQDALLALLQAIPGGSSIGSTGSSSTATGGVDFASAIALYQSQMNQQMLNTMFGTGTTSI
jgi:Ca2+-binding EF-hand superfamily protein